MKSFFKITNITMFQKLTNNRNRKGKFTEQCFLGLFFDFVLLL